MAARVRPHGRAGTVRRRGEGSTAEFEFADSDKTKKKQGPLTTLTTIIGGFATALQQGVVFGDEQLKEVAAELAGTTAPVSTDPASVEFDKAIRAHAKKNNVTYQVAARQLTSQGKSSASYAGTTKGAV